MSNKLFIIFYIWFLPLFKIIVLSAMVPALANSSTLKLLKYSYISESFLLVKNNPHSPIKCSPNLYELVL